MRTSLGSSCSELEGKKVSPTCCKGCLNFEVEISSYRSNHTTDSWVKLIFTFPFQATGFTYARSMKGTEQTNVSITKSKLRQFLSSPGTHSGQSSCCFYKLFSKLVAQNDDLQNGTCYKSYGNIKIATLNMPQSVTPCFEPCLGTGNHNSLLFGLVFTLQTPAWSGMVLYTMIHDKGLMTCATLWAHSVFIRFMWKMSLRIRYRAFIKN